MSTRCVPVSSRGFLSRSRFRLRRERSTRASLESTSGGPSNAHSTRDVHRSSERPDDSATLWWPRFGLAPSSKRAKAWTRGSTYHAVRRLTRQGTFVFLTDSAVGAQEEDNLRHLVTNLGTDVPRERIVPFLTAKHSLEYCFVCGPRPSKRLSRARRPGRRQVGAPRSWSMRGSSARSSGADPTLTLGGWANPHADAERQVEYLTAPDFHAEFLRRRSSATTAANRWRASSTAASAARPRRCPEFSACSSTAARIRGR